VSLSSRLKRLEESLPPPDHRANDPEYQHWRCFYEVALWVLEPFPEARGLVERRVGVNVPLIFRRDWKRTAAGSDMRFYWCKETLWAALGNYPEACAALEAFIRDLEAMRAATKGADGAPGGESVEGPPASEERLPETGGP
jgi:hypothetical protein